MKRLLLILGLLSGSAWATNAPVLFFSDLIAGPASGNSDTSFSSTGGVYVTLYGNFLDSPTAVKLNGSSCLTTVSAPSAWMWYERMVVKLGTTCTSGNFTVTTAAGTSSGIPFTVRSGNIFYVKTTGNDSNAGTFSSPWLTLVHAHLAIAAGDTVYGGNGTTAIVDDGTGWNTCYQLSGNAGTSGNSKAIVAYPGATVSIGSTAANVCTGIRSTGQGSDYWVFAELQLGGSGVAINPYGDIDWRIIGNTVTCPNAGVTDQAGCMDLGGQQSYNATNHTYRVYGNDIEHAATNNAPGSVTGLYHGFYLSEFHNDVDIGWNTIAFVMGGRCFQLNVNEGPGDYDIHIHDGVIHDCPEDGIVSTTVDPSKGTVEIYNMVIYNAGQGPNSSDGGGAWNCMTLEGYENTGVTGESGNYLVYNNTMWNCGTISNPNDGFGETGIMLYADGNTTTKGMIFRNNISYATVATANYLSTDSSPAHVTGSNNLYFGNGAPPAGTGLTGSINLNPGFVNTAVANFHLNLVTSPANGAGTTTGGPVPTLDHDGLVRPSPPAIGAYEFQSVGATFTCAPLTIPARHSNNIAVTCTGSGTSWTGSTVFTISGVTGVTLVSKSNTSGTSETLQITTGTGVGTLTITDTTDSISTTITVATATLAASPATGVLNTTPTVTLTGTNTLWLSETAAGLFTISGGTGSGIATPTVTTNTSATAIVTVGSTAGPETITDTSTTATASFTAVDTAMAPTCSPVAGTYSGGQTITLTDPNSGTHVTCYTQNGTVPATAGDGINCTLGTVYSAPFSQNSTGTVKAISGTSTKVDSSVTSCAYVITGAPAFTTLKGGSKLLSGAIIK